MGVVDEDVVLRRVVTSSRAEDIASVHEAVASVAYAHLFPAPFPREEALARWAEHDGPVVRALRGADLLGFAASSRDGTLQGLYVVPGEAGRGVGSALLDAIGPVERLWVLEGNQAGRAFYEHRGWRWSGSRRAAADADGRPELLYVRKVASEDHQAVGR